MLRLEQKNMSATWKFGQILVTNIEGETLKDVCRPEAIIAATMPKVVDPIPHFVNIHMRTGEDAWFPVEYLYTKNGNGYYRIIR